jgi:hypothetical protein
MARTTIDDVIAIVRAFVGCNYPGSVPLEVRVSLADGRRVVYPVPPPEALALGRQQLPQGCRADICAVLREAGKRLTTSEILTALDKSNRVWGESTVKTNLADMVEDRLITNRQDVRPRGYGLPEWDTPGTDAQTV